MEAWLITPRRGHVYRTETSASSHTKNNKLYLHTEHEKLPPPPIHILPALTGRVLASRVSGCLLDSLVHEKYLILGKKTPYRFWYAFFYKYYKILYNTIIDTPEMLGYRFAIKNNKKLVGYVATRENCRNQPEIFFKKSPNKRELTSIQKRKLN